ncbi:MAG: hypothetical protein ACO1NY_02400 [Pseudorhodoplanes sp.]
MSLLLLLAVCAGIGALAYAIWHKSGYPTQVYRYRMTVEVNLGDEVRSGSSVIEVRLTKQRQILPEVIPVRSNVSGEAVYVDLGEGRNLVALLASGPNAENRDHPQSVVPSHFKLSYSDSDLPKYSSLRGEWTLPKDRLPTFVTFGNLNDLQSAKVVVPDEFEQTFGAGVTLRDVRIEMTDDPVTHGIAEKVPWWNGPFPWLQNIADGVAGDMRSGPFRPTKEHFHRNF